MTDASPLRREFDSRFWFRLRGWLLGLVVCRGLVLMCVLPPFEGWDEFQHVAYVQHIGETNQRPIPGETRIPPSLEAALVAFPQPRCPSHPLFHAGTNAYHDFWQSPQASSAEPLGPQAIHGVPLYEAQHGSLYYRLVAPLYKAAGGVSQLRTSVAVLRLVNLLLTVGAVAIALAIVGRVVDDPRQAGWIGLLIAMHPLFLINGVRVANDALGVFLATAAIGVCFAFGSCRPMLKGLAIGVLTGLAILAKATNFGLLPFVLIVWMTTSVRERLPIRRATLAGALIVAGLVVVLQGEIRTNLARTGHLSAMQEVVRNRETGRTTQDVLRQAWKTDWGSWLTAFWLRDNYCVGGWSFLHASIQDVRAYRGLTIACLLGWVAALARRRKAGLSLLSSWRVPLFCLAICLSYTLAIAYHSILTRLAYGPSAGSGTWYASPTFPWFLVLVGAGGLSWPIRRFRLAFPLALAGIFAHGEASLNLGLMATIYTGGASGFELLRRLAFLQPAFLGSATLIAASAGCILLLAYCNAQLLRASTRRESTDPGTALTRPHLISARAIRSSGTRTIDSADRLERPSDQSTMSPNSCSSASRIGSFASGKVRVRRSVPGTQRKPESGAGTASPGSGSQSK